MVKKIYRSLTNKKIAGVCGGTAEYLGIDPVLVRIICVALVFFHGLGIVAYLIAWLIMPKQVAVSA